MARKLAGWACALAGLVALAAPAAQAAPPPGEPARIAELLAPAQTGGTSGSAGARTQVVGQPFAQIAVNPDEPFEPASAMKVVLGAATERTTADYGAEVTAYAYPRAADPTAAAGSGFETPTGRNLCPDPLDEVAANTRGGVTVQAAQTQMLQASDNPLTRALLLRLGDGSAATGIARLADVVAAAGMTATTLPQDLVGCALINGKRNLTTLSDLARFYDQVERGTLVTPAQRDHLYATMVSGDGFATDAFVQAVDEVATELRASAADRRWLYDGAAFATKGGSYLRDCRNTVTYASCGGGTAGVTRIETRAGIQRLPFVRADGSIGSRTYAVGSWAERRCADANGCPNLSAAVTKAFGESLRSAARDALRSRLDPAERVPVARLAGPVTARAGDAVAFDAAGSAAVPGATVARYDWDFGDGATAQGASATHTFAAPGRYVVGVAVTDSQGRVDVAYTTVTVAPVPAPPTADGPQPAAPAVSAAPVVSPAPVAAAQALRASAPKRVRRGKSLAVRVVLGRAARVSVQVQRSVAGRRRGQRCVAPGKARRGRRCTRVLVAARTAKALAAGASTLRVATRRLAPGRYRVVVRVPGAPTRTTSVRVVR